MVSEQRILQKVESILISQPKPAVKSPYFDLADKHGIRVDFRQFIELEGVTAKEFRKHRISPLDFTAIIFTSRNSIDHFFRICEEMRVKMPQMTKYFCASQAIALYLQKFILYRKRKVFFDKTGKVKGLKDLLKKHKANEKFLLPCATNRKPDLPNFMTEIKCNFAEAPIYRTVASDLSDLKSLGYDMIVFFTPLGVNSLLHNFPDFEQNGMQIAAFGPATAKSVEDAGFCLDIKAPAPGTPSMMMAIDKYLKKQNAEV